LVVCNFEDVMALSAIIGFNREGAVCQHFGGFVNYFATVGTVSHRPSNLLSQILNKKLLVKVC